jgi:twinkle protein
MVLGLERDSQNEDVGIRNTTLIRVLKNRFSGDTGPATYLRYDRTTGRQTEIDKSEMETEEGEETDETRTPDDESKMFSQVIDG